MKKILFLLFSYPAAAFAIPINQLDTLYGSWYTGIDIGYSSNIQANNNLKTKIVGGGNLGYIFSPYVSTELAYQNFGRVKLNNLSHQDYSTYQRLVLSTVLSYPAATNSYPFIKVGATAWPVNAPIDKNGIAPILGVGYRFFINQDFSINVEHQSTLSTGNNNSINIDKHFIKLGISWHFGTRKNTTPSLSHHDYIIDKKSVPHHSESLLNTTKSETKKSYHILFDINSSILTDNLTVKNISQYLYKHPHSHITIIGYSDDTGPDNYNLWLSKRRAKSAAQYLIDRLKIDKNKITIIGNGKLPLEGNFHDIKLSRSLNRRVDVVLTQP